MGDTHVAFVSHGGKGCPIYLNDGDRRIELTPQHAWLIARDLLEAVRVELWK